MAVSPECLVAAAGLAVCGAAVATVAGLAGPALPLAAAAAVAAFGIPVTAALRAWLVDVLLDRGDTGRAIAVARRAHAAARRPGARARAAIDLALAHLAAGAPAPAVPLLEDAAARSDADDHAPALALLAIALVHREGGTAARPLALAREAAAAGAGDSLIAYALGLALLAGGDAAAALPHLRVGAAGEDAALVPSPGERSYALARALAAVGDAAAAREAWLAAARARPPGPFTRRAAERLASGRAGPDLPA